MKQLLIFFVLISLVLATLIMAPIQELIKDQTPYNELHTFKQYGISFLMVLSITYLLLTVFNQIELVVYQYKSMGRKWINNIPTMWRIKQRTPYSFFQTKSSVVRTKYPLVVSGYILLSISCFKVTFTSPDVWYSDLLLIAGFIFLSHATTQFTMHGRTPAILILGNSNSTTIKFNDTLRYLFSRPGISNLIDSKKKARKPLQFIGENFRTLQSFDSEWVQSVHDLIKLSKIIIIDLRTLSPIVVQEIEWVVSSDLRGKKVFFIMSEGMKLSEAYLQKVPHYQMFFNELRCISAIRKSVWMPAWALRFKYSQRQKLKLFRY